MKKYFALILTLAITGVGVSFASAATHAWTTYVGTSGDRASVEMIATGLATKSPLIQKAVGEKLLTIGRTYPNAFVGRKIIHIGQALLSNYMDSTQMMTSVLSDFSDDHTQTWTAADQMCQDYFATNDRNTIRGKTGTVTVLSAQRSGNTLIYKLPNSRATLTLDIGKFEDNLSYAWIETGAWSHWISIVSSLRMSSNGTLRVQTETGEWSRFMRIIPLAGASFQSVLDVNEQYEVMNGFCNQGQALSFPDQHFSLPSDPILGAQQVWNFSRPDIGLPAITSLLSYNAPYYVITFSAAQDRRTDMDFLNTAILTFDK